jgi:hypothetical protein
MTTAISTGSPPSSNVSHRRSVRTLCQLEAKRYLGRLSMWIGAGLTVLFTATNLGAGDYSGDSYTIALPVGFMPMFLGVFIAAVRSGGRDQSVDRPALAEEAPLDRDDRVLARLAGLVVPLVLCALVVAFVAIASRIKGGFWIGDFPRGTESALHSLVEMLQPPLLVALFGAAGVAAGAATKRAAPVIVAGAVVWFMACTVYWAWQSNGLHLFALVQAQPMSIKLPAGTDPSALPTDWFASAPNEFQTEWKHEIIHVPTVLWHNVYLLGLTGLCCGLALRWSLRPSIVAIGLAAAVVGVVGQIVVSPF